MKLLILLSNPFVGGTETFAASIVGYLEKNNIQVDIINTWHNSKVKEFAENMDLSYSELNCKSRHISIKNCKHIIQQVRAKKYDIILGFGIRVSIILRFLKPWFKKTPILIGLRGLDKWRKWYHILPDRLTQAACDIFIPNSNAVAELRIKREKTSRRKIVIIKNGVDTEYFDPQKCPEIQRTQLGLPAGKVIVTTIGNFRMQKGYDFLLNVVKSFQPDFKNIHFLWVGRGSQNQNIPQKINSDNLTGIITILDYTKDVRPILACSNIFILPSREEGMPRALMEAMSMNLPVIATDVGGTGEVVENNKNGFLVDFGDINALGNYIKILGQNSDLRKQMGQEARKRIVEEFNISKIASQYVKLFNLINQGERNGIKIQKILRNKKTITKAIV